MPPLTIGAKLLIAKPKGHMDPDYMADLIVAERVTSMVFTVPTLVSVFGNRLLVTIAIVRLISF
jgi:non-ribosomal peptide synthetase component F